MITRNKFYQEVKGYKVKEDSIDTYEYTWKKFEFYRVK